VAKEEVKVTILDRQFAVNCQKGEKEALMEAASFLDSQIRTIQQQTKLVGLDRCAIIAALNISSELLRFRQGDSAMDLVSERIQVIGERIDDAIREAESVLS
jgi:cell division protein ZapA